MLKNEIQNQDLKMSRKRKNNKKEKKFQNFLKFFNNLFLIRIEISFQYCWQQQINSFIS